MRIKKNSAISIGLIFAVVYTVSYLTRINFGAIVSEMEYATGIGRDLLSLSLTGSFVTYGIGQVISGLLVDRISAKKLMTAGLLVTASMNLLLPFFINPYIMLVIWCINGFAQSFMWPPIVKLMSQLLDDEGYKKAAVIVSWGSSVGTMLAYLSSPLIISFLNWRWVFGISSIIGYLAAVLWQKFPYTHKPVTAENGQKTSARLLFSPVMLTVMLAIILQGMLRDGVTTWMPSYISETYHWATATSILTAVILPIFSVLCFQAASKLYQTVFKNPLLCAGVFYLASLLATLTLYMATGKQAIVSVLCAAILTGCMHGVNMMLISMLPAYFKRYGVTGTASGVLNSCTYIGSAISTYGVAVLSENRGWKLTVLIWAVIAMLGTILCFACIRGFKKMFS